MSGDDADNDLTPETLADARSDFLPKPSPSGVLLDRVRAVLTRE